ncbi:hypothetical protein [Actinoplanes flavus]|uniref:Immunity protein 53 n=1 Tax=Actinoplanes flavus TaxID=2820290 RepID=A0ABS3UFK0_9ACTN|nr:hypothetical protein [Actinoplanes flavus]MBO3737544.1 hypothetical protein [Actinoplanes flavus]
MGYEFHITRAENWFESEIDPISRRDWEELADSTPELRFTGYVDWSDIGPQRIYEPHGDATSFTWRGGKVDIKGVYSGDTERLAHRLAEALGGRIQGDDED